MKLRHLLTPAVMIALAGVAAATPLTYNLEAGSGTPSTSTGTGAGNVFTYTTGGVTVKVTSWSLTGTGATFEAATTGRWSPGLGICSDGDPVRCGSPDHQVDNSGGAEFLLFQFSSAVDPTTVRIDPYGVFDSDVTYFTGTTAANLNLGGKTLANLAALGFSTAQSSYATPSDNARLVTINNAGPVTSLLFGASTSGSDDFFKVSTLNADCSPVPEPGTFAGLGAALVGLGLLRKRSA